MNRWFGQVAVVTGASSGIGASIAQKLAESGIKVVAISRRNNHVQELAEKLKDKPGRLIAVKADITNEEDILETFKWIKENLGPIHILINNAGVVLDTNLIDGDTQLWKQTLDTNVLGLCIATREAVRDMRANDVSGHIVHINSVLGYTALNIPNFNVYTASKFGVTALTETLRQELCTIGSKIKVTSIAPGAVDTEFSSRSELFVGIYSYIPLLKPEDVADAVMYVLATPPHVQVHCLMLKPVGEGL